MSNNVSLVDRILHACWTKQAALILADLIAELYLTTQ